MFIDLWKGLKERGILGMNARNGSYIMPYNKRSLYPLVDDKILTKELGIANGVPVPELYKTVASEKEIADLVESDFFDGLKEFVIKPAQGAGGDGIVIITDQRDGRFRKPSGAWMDMGEIEHHLSNTLSGIYSLGGARDRAMIEYKIAPDPLFEKIMYKGVPDIRIIVLKGYPAMGMIRLPTSESDGKANLHQGAIGVGLDLATGKTLKAVHHNSIVEIHPDTDNPVSGVQIPNWDDFMMLATKCYELSGLGYLGVDIVLDKDKGPLMLELNARPGLNIQIANDDGLQRRYNLIEAEPDGASPEERMAFSKKTFAV